MVLHPKRPQLPTITHINPTTAKILHALIALTSHNDPFYGDGAKTGVFRVSGIEIAMQCFASCISFVSPNTEYHFVYLGRFVYSCGTGLARCSSAK